MFPSYQSVLAQFLEKPIALLTMNRPQAANALNTHMALELYDAFAKLQGNQDCRAIILTGEGKHFCAGADLKERKGMTKEAWQEQHHAFESVRQSLLDCQVPVIAAVNGAAMGGGLELALCCDFIYAAKDARFALTEATLGIMPGLGGTQTLWRCVGMARAKELLFTGKIFSAEQAYGFGMVNHLSEPEMLLEDAHGCAKAIAANAPLSVRSIKQAITEGTAKPLAEGLAIELRYYNNLLHSADRQEGINAFNEKRKPRFTGE